jgi:hypothetical protein
MLENPQSVLWILRCWAFSFSPDPRISGFLLMALRVNMDIILIDFDTVSLCGAFFLLSIFSQDIPAI